MVDNPLLTQLRARIPGETFRLPSIGIFYENGELADEVADGEVHVYPLTTLDEIVLGTPDKLLNGKAVEEVFSRCIPQVKQPMKLLSKDVDFLLSCLRLLTHGPSLVLSHQHSCENAKPHEYTVNLQQLVSSAKTIDPTSVSSKFKITLDNGQVISIHPPVFDSVVNLYQTIAFAKENQEEDQTIAFHDKLVKTYANVIDNVDGVTDRDMIVEWLKALPAGLSKQFTDNLEVVGDWGLQTTVSFECKDCGESFTLDANTNPISFFM